MRSYTVATLPTDYTPGPNSIIIGRGRQVKDHVANKKFDRMVSVIALEYQAAGCKAEKGNILSKLITKITSEGSDAGFVKKDPITGRWVQVEESLARTTAAQAIRNHLHSCYRSSKQFKQKRRLQQIRDGIIPTSGSSGALKSQRCISPETSDSDDEGSVSQMAQRVDTFSILFTAFGSAADLRSDDPFAPTPIKKKTNDSMASLLTLATKLQAVAPVSPKAGPSILSGLNSHLMAALLSQIMAPTAV